MNNHNTKTKIETIKQLFNPGEVTFILSYIHSSLFYFIYMYFIPYMYVYSSFSNSKRECVVVDFQRQCRSNHLELLARCRLLWNTNICEQCTVYLVPRWVATRYTYQQCKAGAGHTACGEPLIKKPCTTTATHWATAAKTNDYFTNLGHTF